MIRKFALFILLSYGSVSMSMDNAKKFIKATIARPGVVGFVLSYGGKYAYKKTDITNPLTKKIAFGLTLVPAALLYLHKYSEDNSAKRYVLNVIPNSLEFTTAIGAGLLVPAPE